MRKRKHILFLIILLPAFLFFPKQLSAEPSEDSSLKRKQLPLYADQASLDNSGDIDEAEALLADLEADIRRLEAFLNEDGGADTEKEDRPEEGPLQEEKTSESNESPVDDPAEPVKTKKETTQPSPKSSKKILPLEYAPQKRSFEPQAESSTANETDNLFSPSFEETAIFTKDKLAFGNQEIELERLESAIIDGDNITRFLSTNSSVVRLERVSEREIKVYAVGLGHAIIHIWDVEGRRTIRITVKQRGIKRARKLIERLAEAARGETLKIRLSSDTVKTHSRSKTHTTDYEFSDVSSNITVEGGSPFGDLYTSLSFRQKSDADSRDRDISEFIFSLEGKNYSLIVGDSFADYSELSLPFTHFQGVHYQTTLDKDLDVNLITGATGNRLWGDNLFFGEGSRYFHGAKFDLRTTDFFTLSFIDVEARGASEFPDQIKSVLAELDVNKLNLLTEFAGNDEDDFSWSTKGTYATSKFNIESIYRDYDPEYRTISGDVPHRGERGIYSLGTYDPFDTISLAFQHDYFEHRFNRNLDRLGYYNTNLNLISRLDLPMDMFLTARYFYRDFKGTSSPNELMGQGINITKNYSNPYLLTTYLDLESSKSRSETSRSSDFNNIRAQVGMTYRVIDNLFLDVSESWNFRRFIEDEMQASPKRFTARLNYNSRIFESDLYTILSMQYQRDSGTSENRISFTGEELVSAEGELRYIPANNWEAYLRGRFSEIDGIVDGTLDRQETSIFAGATYLFDTGIRFEFLGRIRGRVFRDADSDGRFTPDKDVPYHNVLVKHGKKKTLSDLNGLFLFDHVSPGKQKVELDMKKFPKGSVLTTANPQEVLVHQMKTAEILFGVTTRTLLSGFVFNDLDSDNVYTDHLDEGLGNVRILVADTHDAISNRVGFFTMKNLIPGTYKVKIDGKTFPKGLLPSFPKGVDVTIKEGGVYRKNVPMYALRAIMGAVYIDADGNGERDPGEEGVEGIKLECQGKAAVTGKKGAYIFRKLDFGRTVVTIIQSSMPPQVSIKGPAERVIDLPKEAVTEQNIDFSLKRI